MTGTARLQRSELAVPGVSRRFIEKAAAGAADAVFLDLEDAVAPPDKEQARRTVIEALHDVDWSGRTVSVRINGLDTPYMYRDLVDVMEQAGDRLDTIMVPKVDGPADLHCVETIIGQIERAKGFERRVGTEALIESALGMSNVDAIAAAGGRLEALHFGPGDFAASIGARSAGIGARSPHYPGDQWHYALSRIVVACRTNGLRPIDGAYGNLSDEDGYLQSARQAAALGCDGKWAIHPSQITPANEVFTPPEEEVAHARRVVGALEQAGTTGRGAVTLDGVMIDAASERMARTVLALDEAIRAIDT